MFFVSLVNLLNSISSETPAPHGAERLGVGVLDSGLRGGKLAPEHFCMFLSKN